MRLLITIFSLFLISCTSNLSTTKRATAIIYDLQKGHKLGNVDFHYNEDNIVLISVNLKMIPAGEHGFHIHENGDISNNGHNLGGHFNPLKVKHGNPQEGFKVHIGDLGNITANKNGIIKTKFTDIKLSLTGKYSIIGRSVVLHADKDNFEIQPSGHSGKKIAAGVIGIAK